MQSVLAYACPKVTTNPTVTPVGVEVADHMFALVQYVLQTSNYPRKDQDPHNEYYTKTEKVWEIVRLSK